MEISKNPKEKIKVLYCMGSGRSGSTLLNIILDNHPEVASLGELNNVTRFRRAILIAPVGRGLRIANFGQLFWKIGNEPAVLRISRFI